MIGKSQSAGTGDNRMYGHLSQFINGFCQQGSQSLLNIGKMPFIVSKQNLMRFIQNGNFNRGGTDIDSQGIIWCVVCCSSNNCHLLFCMYMSNRSCVSTVT